MNSALDRMLGEFAGEFADGEEACRELNELRDEVTRYKLASLARKNAYEACKAEFEEAAELLRDRARLMWPSNAYDNWQRAAAEWVKAHPREEKGA